MKILIYSLYSPPELTGIGKYNGEMIEWLGDRGHEIDLITTFPFYPQWEVSDPYKNEYYKVERPHPNIKIYRSWSYVPEKVTGLGRVLQEVTFTLSSTVNILKLLLTRKYDLIISIAPPFHLAFSMHLFSRIKKAPHLYHIQDLQINAARELKMLPKILLTPMEKVEQYLISQADLISTISTGMMKKIAIKEISLNDIYYFPNWTDISKIKPVENNYWLHDYLQLSHQKKLIVYSGNIGKKQGLELLIPVAKKLESNSDIHFVILGTGAYKDNLVRAFEKENLGNVSFGNLVAVDDLNKMLNSSFIQLVLQKKESDDSFLPSKLTNIFAAGCVSIVTATPNAGLYNLITKYECALAVEPGNVNSLVNGIERLLSNKKLLNKFKNNARSYAENYLSKEKILSDFEHKLKELKNKNKY